ncbi:type IV secretion system protein [Legionella lytica]|uniref:Type IV secretion system protein n=1 Tax=Legionella lytica TaxID=96232 RepID=A0ABW8DBL2_9GAMM
MGFLYYDTVVTGLVRQIDTLMVEFVHHGYNALTLALKGPLAAVGALSIVLIGYGITYGFIKAPMKELYKWIIRMGFIYFFFMSWGHFSEYVVGLFDTGAGQLGSAIMKATHTPLAGKSIAQGLQTSFTDVFHVGLWTIKKASLKNWWPILTALFIWLSGTLVTVVALYEIIGAKILLSICLATAPLFIIFVLFDKTRAFFDRWLGQVIGYSLVIIFVSTVIGLSNSLIHASIAGYLPEQAESMNSVGWAPIFLVALLCTALLAQAALIAKHIGGACHTAGGGAMAAAAIGGAAGVLMMMKNSYQKMKDSPQSKSNSGGSNAQENGLQDTTHYATRGEL